MVDLLEKNPKLLATSELIRINRTMSYMTFIFKDIKEYVLKKLNDDVYYEELRYARKRINELKNKL